MSINTTVDFRRNLLRFERPLHLDYTRHNIPRYYSNFGPRFRTYFEYCDHHQEPEIYPLNNIRYWDSIHNTEPGTELGTKSKNDTIKRLMIIISILILIRLIIV